MALNLSQYVDPGVYISEVVVPGSVTATTAPLTVCLVGTGTRTKRATNEAVVRGVVSDEKLTLEQVPSLGNAWAAKLAHKSNRRASQLFVKRDGVELDPAYFSYGQAFALSGTHAGTIDLNPGTSGSGSISLSLDGKRPVTIKFIGIPSGTPSTNIPDGDTRNLIEQEIVAADMNSVSVDTVVEGINNALANASSIGYGSAYSAVATKTGTKILLKSPLSSQASNVELFDAYADSATAAVFNGLSLPFSADSYVTVASEQHSETSTYLASYVATDSSVDALLNTDVQNVLRIGKYAGVTSYEASSDYTLSNDSISWAVASGASVVGVAGPVTGLSASSVLSLNIDNLGAIDIEIAAAGDAPGSADPSNIASVTVTEIKNNINAALADSKVYGPKYAATASVNADGKLELQSKLTGPGASVVVASGAVATALFGGAVSAYGSGSRPAPGQIYFVTYEYTRPSSDYNKPKRFYTPDSLYADIGVQSSANKLALAANICFQNGAPSVMVVQVNDASFVGNPTRDEVKAALDAAGLTSVATEICLLDTREVCRVDLIEHVSAQNSPIEKNWRRGWFGMPRNTEVGDTDTPGTFVYTAVNGMAIPADSPARGRLILVAPGSASCLITLESGATATVDVDSSFVAAAIAARMTSFTSPAETLLRKSIVGFSTDTFPTYVRAERAELARHGITVVTLDGGQLKLTDPVTTEDAGGKLATFREISASTQKDAVTMAVNDVVDANLVGVVPSDMSAFIVSVKSYIANALTSLISIGAIAPFKTADGRVQDIDISKDIQVLQDRSDPTKFAFKYFFNLRLPAKRFVGEYSVNNPFFGQ